MKKKTIKGFLLTTVFVLGLGMLTGCGGNQTDSGTTASGDASTSNSEPTSIRVWIDKALPENAPVFVALQEGFFDDVFADDNVEIEALNFNSGPAAIEAFEAGELDAASGLGDQPTIIGMTNGVDSVIIGRSCKSTAVGIIVQNDSDISSVADLKGKKISVHIGTAYQKLLMLNLSDAGLGADDVELVNMTDDTEQIAALDRGEVDAIFVSSYRFLTAEDKGVGKILINGEKRSDYSFLEFSEKFANEHPDLIEKYVQALKKAEDFARENPEQAYQDIADYCEIDVEQAKIVVGANDFTLTLDDSAKQDFYETADFLYEQGLISQKVDKTTIDEHFSNLLEE